MCIEGAKKLMSLLIFPVNPTALKANRMMG